MDANIVAALVGGVAGIMAGGIPQIFQALKDRRNGPRDDFSAVMAAAREAAETVKTYSSEINNLQVRLNANDKKILELEKDLKIANERALRFEDWAKRLAQQVRDMHGIPYDLDPTRPLGSNP